MSDYEPVLFIEMTDGMVESIVLDSRVVRETSKGRYVQTTSNGRVYLDKDNVAVLSWRHHRTVSGHMVRKRSTETVEGVEDGVRGLLQHFGLHVWTTLRD